jgi:rhodanese-related sulfurtransferase
LPIESNEIKKVKGYRLQVTGLQLVTCNLQQKQIIMGFFDFLMGSSTSNEELTKLIQEGAMLVDVRSPGEFSTGSAKGAVNIPLDNVGNSLNKFKNKSHIIVFCRSGNRSGQAKSILERNGFTNVTNGGTWDQVAALVK